MWTVSGWWRRRRERRNRARSEHKKEQEKENTEKNSEEKVERVRRDSVHVWTAGRRWM